MIVVAPILFDHWPLLKAVRLQALAEAPYAFGTTFAEAMDYSDFTWQARARRFSEKPAAAGCLGFWDDVPCGMATAYPSEEDARHVGLTSFWVSPEHRGRGVANAMVTFLADWATVQGFTALEADVVEDNARARAFYRKMGFQDTGRTEPFRRDLSKRLLRLAKPLECER